RSRIKFLFSYHKENLTEMQSIISKNIIFTLGGKKMENNNIAIFFDAENVSARYVSTILAKTSSYGNIVIQRAYADWSIPNTKQWKEIVARQPINVIQQFHNGETQVIDKTIIMDAIQIAIERPEINVFFIVASDKGYANLALRLRENLGNVSLV
ncbi:MAG: NYN domain-containing protein, partial [Treponema sp.]|nr:NYN domain-containing protein [Treponema sp.]